MLWLRTALLWLLLGGTALAAPLRVALLLEDDSPSAWTEMLRQGLAKASGSHNISHDVIIAPPGPGQTELFRQVAATHDLVIVAEDSLHEVLRDNAASFRRVKFGVIDAGIRAPNIMAVTFADEQAAFLAGAAAAAWAKTRGAPVVGWLSGGDTPAMRSLFNGYNEGAILEAPGTRVIQAVVGSFNDPAQAASKALWLADNGAQVIALAAGAGNKAASEALKARNIPLIELDGPRSGNDMGVITRAADKAIGALIAATAADNFQGKKILTYDLANGGVSFDGLAEFTRKATAGSDLLRRQSELGQEIRKGAIRLHSLRQRTLCDCLD